MTESLLASASLAFPTAKTADKIVGAMNTKSPREGSFSSILKAERMADKQKDTAVSRKDANTIVLDRSVVSRNDTAQEPQQEAVGKQEDAPATRMAKKEEEKGQSDADTADMKTDDSKPDQQAEDADEASVSPEDQPAVILSILGTVMAEEQASNPPQTGSDAADTDVAQAKQMVIPPPTADLKPDAEGIQQVPVKVQGDNNPEPVAVQEVSTEIKDGNTKPIQVQQEIKQADTAAVQQQPLMAEVIKPQIKAEVQQSQAAAAKTENVADDATEQPVITVTVKNEKQPEDGKAKQDGKQDTAVKTEAIPVKDEKQVTDTGDKTYAETDKSASESKDASQKEDAGKATEGKEPKQADGQAKTKGDVKKIIDLETARLNVTKKAGVPGTEIKSAEQDEKLVQDTDDTQTTVSTVGKETMRLDFTAKQPVIMEKAVTAETKVEPKEVIRQIVDRAEFLVKGNKSSVVIELKPEFLGKVQIALSVQDGVVSARFTTDNNQVRHILEGGLGQLRTALESTGIKLERAEVNVDLGQSDMSQQFQQFQQSKQWQEQNGTGQVQHYNISGYQEPMEDGAEAAVTQTVSNETGVNYLA